MTDSGGSIRHHTVCPLGSAHTPQPGPFGSALWPTATDQALPTTPKRKLEFAYDGQGRRVSKKAYKWDGSTWAPDSSRLFLYDGWNLAAELLLNPSTSTFNLNSSYAWGLDLSGSLQGAGGVGGLLFTQILDPGTQTLKPHSAAFDGNGNVIGYVDMATGAKSATYEYNAFGETLIADGSVAVQFVFRFSTKYAETETGFLYYGQRYYNPTAGRWLNRDPMEERAGLNAYAFIVNTPVDAIDSDGRQIYLFEAPPVMPSPGISTSTSTSNVGQNFRFAADFARPAVRTPMAPPAPLISPMPSTPRSQPRWKIENETDISNPDDWLFRAMTGTAKPDIGEIRDKLGVRPGEKEVPGLDVIIIKGTVNTYMPSGKIQGLSTTPSKAIFSMAPNILRNILPVSLGGREKLPVWAIKRAVFERDPKLLVHPDSESHTTIAPSGCIGYPEYKAALERTQPEWRRVMIYEEYQTTGGTSL